MTPIKPPHPVLTLLEGRAVLEAGGLLMTLPLLRLGAKKGHGESVIVLPGFMADDRSTRLLREFLRSIDYNALPWGLGTNRRPMTDYLPLLYRQVREIFDDTGEKVRLIGWSRGGMLAREVARDYPELIHRVITIGSPVKGGVSASAIARWVQAETGLTPTQMARLTEERYQKPIRTPVRAIYSRTDGVVAWKACVDDLTENVRHYEVTGSHIGLGSNIEVFRLLPRLLSDEKK